ncbi:kinetochore protein Nuf2 [Marchantia polymorpha subsp. ruderalis]|uniref:Kinetochore protein Nuf2 N-terminal domain-containing protein n=2 Tax=Marchantia polymorpha TaxID=3197 RepID=A0AAF6B179_MARPO|nr:hypothetical protein MARPO_0004s0096 [Marchantia polymorpha]BBN05763.1 hypothetical protein Mp_3g15760 [Marchantia polymorpha subsp. ruderalis]|eukprot:PTQ48816.1 hypothetical protein MARPO_0004s0096 [Marchantia polymorpha]
MPSLTFPDLETKQIVMLMKELGVNLEEKNLLNPTSEIMWPLYETVAQNLLGISREELQQPAFNVLCKLEYSELHEESVCSIASWRIIRQLMFAAGVTDFTFRDLIKPDSRRTIRNLSGLINYARFRAEREDKLAALQDESLLDTKLQLEDDIEEVKREIAAIEAERKGQIPLVQALEAETHELWQDVSALNKRQSVFQSEIRALKQELNSINDAISGQKYMLQQAKQEETDLRGQIVQSPEKLQRSIEEQKIILEKTEIAVEEARKSLNRWEQKLESFSKAEKKVLKYLGRLEEAQKLLTTQKTATKQVKGLKAKIKADEEEERHQNTKLAELTLKGDHCQELIDNAERLNLSKTEEQERSLEEIKERYSQLIKRQQEADLPSKEAQVQYLINQIAKIINTKEDVIRSFREEVAGIQQQVLAYYRAILSCTGPLPQLSG